MVISRSKSLREFAMQSDENSPPQKKGCKQNQQQNVCLFSSLLFSRPVVALKGPYILFLRKGKIQGILDHKIYCIQLQTIIATLKPVCHIHVGCGFLPIDLCLFVRIGVLKTQPNLSTILVFYGLPYLSDQTTLLDSNGLRAISHLQWVVILLKQY